MNKPLGIHDAFRDVASWSDEISRMWTESSYLFGMAERIAKAAEEAGEITSDDCKRWLEELNELAAKGNFFSSINYYICAGNKC